MDVWMDGWMSYALGTVPVHRRGVGQHSERAPGIPEEVTWIGHRIGLKHREVSARPRPTPAGTAKNVPWCAGRSSVAREACEKWS